MGAIDWNLRDFHGYETPRGTTYNAYLVRGAEKTALVDTVKVPFVPELLERDSLASCRSTSIDYIVVNHIEPDHNGGLRAVMEAMPEREGRRLSRRRARRRRVPRRTSRSTAVGADDVDRPRRPDAASSCRCRWCTGRTRCSPTAPSAAR